LKVKAYKLNSFSNQHNGGNPAAVVMAGGLTAVQMQELAARINFSETAFVEKIHDGCFALRFFTPRAEVDLCGHATIAAFCLMKEMGLLRDGCYCQETKAGKLDIVIEGKTVFMEQVLPQFFEVLAKEEIAICLGLKEEELSEQLPVQAVSTGLKDILVPLKSNRILKRLQPDMKKIEEISAKYHGVGLHTFSLLENGGAMAVCRNFAPLYGIPEESATGTSNGALACYLYKYGVVTEKNKEIYFEQGISMNKPSLIRAKLSAYNGTINKIWIGGEAILLEEEIFQI
jgi:PhzF family phenazine biosynthesis protein